MSSVRQNLDSEDKKMKKSKFMEFWDKWSTEWYNSTEVIIGDEKISVSKLCKFKKNYAGVLYNRYKKIKTIIRQSYFPPSDCSNKDNKFSRYKRAAIIAYTINGASPLIYTDPSIKIDLDHNFLKQRLAFFVAIGSIIQDFPQQEVELLEKQGPIFDFDSLGKMDDDYGQDPFLLSVYKDLFYSEIYENYNVLTMANVFGLLTERASKLREIKPLPLQKG